MSGDEKTPRNYILSALTAGLLIIPFTKGCTDIMPIDAFRPWHMSGSNPLDWLLISWPIFAWGLGVNILFALWQHFRTRKTHRAGFDHTFLRERRGPSVWDMLWGGTLISLWAGVTEELAFRWLIFGGAFLGLWVVNFIFSGTFGLIFFGILLGAGLGGFIGRALSRNGLGFGVGAGIIIGLAIVIALGVKIPASALSVGIPELFHLHVWGPLADWTTFGYLHPWIFHKTGWIIGAAMLSSNAFFRDGHKYQGLFGVINAWFAGMFFFWLMWNHGLLAAILVHFTYDFIIFAFAAARQGIQR